MSESKPFLSVVVIIPARGGSKGIPKKNLIQLGGKPLIAWPIELAKSIKRVSRIIVSTDDEEIMKVASAYGAEVPFKRPEKLAGDSVTTLPVLQHALTYLAEAEQFKPDVVLLLYPSSPFLKAERINQALDLFEKTLCNSVLGVKKVRGLTWKLNQSTGKYQPYYPKTRVNRQFFTPLFEEAGNIFFSRYTVLMNDNRIVDPDNVEFVFVEEDEQIDIDTQADLEKAKQYL